MPELRAPEYVAKRLGISAMTARRLMARGEIRSRNIAAKGSRDQWRTTDQYIDAFIAGFGSEQPTETARSGGVQLVPRRFDRAA